jgi:hypothetical protein
VVAGGLSVIINLITLLILGFGQEPFELLVRSVISPIAGALLVLGLVGLYARQSEAIDVIGLIGFLLALFGTISALAGNIWANLLAYLGWALFGVSSWQARVYPPAAAILLTVSAVLTAPFSALIAGELGNVPVYVGLGANTIFSMAVAWLGFALFTGRGLSADQPRPEKG